MNDLTTTEETTDVPLPVVYQKACEALVTCERVDECKAWADKSAALASYAKQAEDDTLMAHARKIQLRAVRRMGELIDAVPPGKTGPKLADGADSQLSRREFSADAGISERQQVTAQRVARVPEDEFEHQVESEQPPTVSALAEQGKMPPAKPPEPPASTEDNAVTLFADWTKKHPAPAYAKMVASAGHDQVTLTAARKIAKWLADLDSALNTAPAVISIPIVGGGEHPVTQADIDQWAELFIGIDVLEQLRMAKAWCLGNPQRQKTARGVGKFITGWLMRAQDRGRGKGPGPASDGGNVSGMRQL